MNNIPYGFVFLLLIISSCNRPVEVNNQNDGIPPAVPANIRIFADYDGEIGIEWQGNSEADIKGYNIYRSTDNINFVRISFTTTNNILDDSLDYNTTYYYKITAIDNSNLESSPTKEVSAKPVNKYKPYRIQNISINARNWKDTISIFLSWTPSGETDIAGYNVYRSQNSGFSPDSTTFVGLITSDNFNDTSNLKLYTNYFYKIKALDNGALLSDESAAVSDEILEIPEVVFPENNSTAYPFNNFIIKAIKVPATYKIVVQSNEYFGEIWSNTFSTSITDNPLTINFNSNYIYVNKYYYWRVITFSKDNSEPNSISRLYKFIIKQ